MKNPSDRKNELVTDELDFYSQQFEEKDERDYYQMFNIDRNLYFNSNSIYNRQLFEKPVIVCLRKDNPFLLDETMVFIGPLELYKYYEEGISNA